MKLIYHSLNLAKRISEPKDNTIESFRTEAKKENKKDSKKDILDREKQRSDI